MSTPIEDYAIIGDCHTAALVAKDGSIDWWCVPRFDSPACFAALLGDAENGRWRIAPSRNEGPATVERSYFDHTLILQTTFRTANGAVTVHDYMPRRDESAAHIVRVVEGVEGTVAMRNEVAFRFNYGSTTPWVTQLDEGRGVRAIGGPDMCILRAPMRLRGEGMHTVSDFTVAAGERLVFTLSHSPSHLPPPEPIEHDAAYARNRAFWEDWADAKPDAGPYSDLVCRSLMVLKALTYAPTGGIVAAATTSLPESIGGVRNWDYRFCWLRDSTLTLRALMNAGYYDEAAAWGDWLERAIAGDVSQLRIMYGLAGERRLEEWEVDWLAGYEHSKPVRVGNAASNQLQLDVYGQVLGSIHYAREAGIRTDDDSMWPFQRKLLEHLETIWMQPDFSIWESRDGPKQFTFSKMMVWVAFDRAVCAVEEFGNDGPVERWRALRQLVHDQICEKAYDRKRNTFVQSYGSKALDASLLLIPMMGFLPPDDPRVIGTVAAIEKELLVDGFVLRYRTDGDGDGLPPGEGVFLACSFWLVESYRVQGRLDEARALFERLVALANDVGLLAEEYDPVAKRQVGNFPQAFSHVALINAALGLERAAHGDFRPARRPAPRGRGTFQPTPQPA